jgi:hypothetical protein
MKRILSVVLGFLVQGIVFAQTVSITGPITDFTPNAVIGSFGTPPNTNRYHVSEQLYTNAEIGNNFTTVGTAITQINFYLKTAGSPLSVANYRVSMQNISGTTTAFTSGAALASSDYTVVFDGTLDATPIDGLVKIVLTTPFVRTPGTNLVIKLERLNGVSHPGFEFFCARGNNTSTSANTTRRSNGNTVPTASTSLAASSFRPSIQLIHTFSVDAKAMSFTLPSVSCFNSNQQIQVSLLNDGTTSINPGTASVTLNINGANTFTATSQNSGNILPGEFELFNFTGINLNNPGANQITAYVVLNGDFNQSNDTISTSYITSSTTSTFPISENFESGAGLQFIHFETLAGNRNLWELQTGSYDNNDFVPQAINPIAPGNKFYLFNTYDYPNTLGFVGRMYSNCISLPAPTATTVPVITLSFFMSHDNTFLDDQDSLRVSISTDRGNTWSRLAAFIRPDATASVPTWRIENIDLTPFGGQTVQLAFEGTSAGGNAFGLDNVNLNFSMVLPVSMLDFDAKRNGNANHLTWTTAQEVNVDRFEVEFSEDGKNFKSIGRLNATNQASSKQTYRYIDNRTSTGIHYYRIRSVDRDSKFSLSEVRSVRNLGYASMTVFPNPVSNQLNLQIDLEKAENAVYFITDLSGRRVQTGRFNLNEGSNRMPVSCTSLPKGTYILTLQLNNETLVKKITKL